MNAPITIVMYHYVRPIRHSAWPGIKGLESEFFERQLDHIAEHHTVVTLADVIAHHRGEGELPGNAMVLTFDDGYSDHFRHVFPALRRRGYKAAFFPPATAVYEREMLDVNKVHFTLASVQDPGLLAAAVDAAVREHALAYGLESTAFYRQRFAVGDDFDPPEVIYVKRMLQHGLPEELRRRVADALFTRFVSTDPRGFADDLYMSLDDLAVLRDSGMEIGSHGDAHVWLNTLAAERQRADIAGSLRLLDDLGLPRGDFLFCYPYGAFNDATLNILADLDCGAAVTSRRGLADPGASLYELARLDAVDIPGGTAAVTF